MKKKRWMGAAVFLMAGIALTVCLWNAGQGKAPLLSYPEFWLMAADGQIKSVEISGGEYWLVECADGEKAKTPDPRAEDGKERLLALGIDVKEKGETMPLLGAGIVAALVLFLFGRSNRQGAVGLQKYAAIEADERIPKLSFSDIALPDETMNSMWDLADFLREPERFRRLGARPPKGVMLYGPPGTGKTLLARALAGETKKPFFALSGADFVQVYVGVGASRVREVFRKARKAGSGVIFIDEIDAIGKKRDNGNDEREQTLNALLTEMSGFSPEDGIMVLAATNRLDTLDPALLREGRFDRRIEIGLPDREQRRKILAVHSKNKPMDKKVNLDTWAEETSLFSGAQLESMLNEAAIRAGRRKSEWITDQDIRKAYLSLTVGDERKRLISKEEKKILSCHEAGHALITYCLLPSHRLTRLSIIPSSKGAAGYSMSVKPDQILYSKKDLEGMLCAALAGRAAEEISFGKENVTTGASDDIKKAREIASAMAKDFMMGSEWEDEKDEKGILEKAMEKTRTLLKKYQDALNALSKELLEKETLENEQIENILKASLESLN